MCIKAILNNVIIAESHDTIVVEGNHYFPAESVNKEYLEESDYKSACPWKGLASYFNIKIGDEIHHDSAWYYPDPKDAAKEIKDRIAFWNAVQVIQ